MDVRGQGGKLPPGAIEMAHSRQKYSQVPNKRGILINRGVGKHSEINKQGDQNRRGGLEF